MSNLVSLDDYEKRAHQLLPLNALDYYKSGAGDQLTLSLNRTCFDKLRIRPRIMRDISNRDMSCNILGLDLSCPIGIAPTAMQKMCHDSGELANCAAAGKENIIFTLSTIATSSIEQIAEACPSTKKWFQLYIYKDRELTMKLVRRVEACNFKALVLTVDTPVFGLRRADMRNKFTLPEHLQLGNFTGEMATSVKSSEGSGIQEYVTSQFDQSLTWKDIKWLLGITTLPVIVKGILTDDDAKIALDLGVAGIVVSNHGARQLDSVPASIEALPEIARVINGKIPIFFDGGVRQGTDVFKALALGASMVFIGRPALYGLTVNGQEGVEHVINILKKELDVTMALTGCLTLKDIKKEMIVHENFYAKL